MDAEYTVTGDPELSPSGKSRIPIVYKGQDAWLYGDNGNRSIRNSSGHWLTSAENAGDRITTETTDSFRQLRKEKARKAAEAGAILAAESKTGLTLNDPTDAWLYATEARMEVALDTQHRGGNAAYELVGKAAGWLATKSESTEAPALTLSADGIAALVAAVQREQERRVADVVVVDVGSGRAAE